VRQSHAMGLVVAVGLALAALAPNAVAGWGGSGGANGGGWSGGGHGGRGGHHPFPFGPQPFNWRGLYQWPFAVADYGFAPYYYYPPDMSDGYAAGVVAVQAERQPALSCHHSRDVITVRAEGGGTKEITITRC